MDIYKTFDNERLMHERDLLLAEIREEVTSFLDAIIDDHHILAAVETEAIKRGLLDEHTPMPFIIGVPEQAD
jgi:hypothetical protein